jgi:hypothetical protein
MISRTGLVRHNADCFVVRYPLFVAGWYPTLPNLCKIFKIKGLASDLKHKVLINRGVLLQNIQNAMVIDPARIFRVIQSCLSLAAWAVLCWYINCLYSI